MTIPRVCAILVNYNAGLELRRAVRQFERDHIQRTLVATGWSRKEAARRLGISTTSLWRRMTELGIEEPGGG